MNAKVLKKGEEIFSTIDEKCDKKCYEINNIKNWADCFYTYKSGIILDRYKQIISRTENNKFFEALNYEYGINNYPLDTNKALHIYKMAADKSPDTLSMYRLYHIYKKDFRKFNIKKRNFVLEKFYIMKCYSYLTAKERKTYLYKRFDITNELRSQLLYDNKKFFTWFSKLIKFLNNNHKIYNINKDDVILIEEVIRYEFGDRGNFTYTRLNNLAKKENPQAIYNLAILMKNTGKLYYDKLYNLNYYRSFGDYVNFLSFEGKSPIIIKKSLLNGYYSHIKYYLEIFSKNNEFEDIFKLTNCKSEFMFIIGCMIDAIIADEIDILIDFIYIRKIAIKHFNFFDEFKTFFDIYIKGIIDYLITFRKGTEEENIEKAKLYYINSKFYNELNKVLTIMYYNGIIGIIEKDYKKALNILSYLPLNNDNYKEDIFNTYLNYSIKNRERKNYNNQKRKNNSNKQEYIKINDEELIKIEKKLLNMYYKDFIPEKIKKFPPSHFYIMSKLYSSSSINNEDKIFEYVLLNRASNASLSYYDEFEYEFFQEKYIQYKTKKKLEEKNGKENLKISYAKGIINVAGYGEDGIICPICIENKKSTICLPCKHFFCNICIKKLLEKGTCPICRTEIKITFDINLKKENLVESILSDSNIY